MVKIKFKGEIKATEDSASYVADQIDNLVEQDGGVVNITQITDDDVSRLKKRISEIVEYWYSPNKDGGMEMYVNYDDELSDRQIKEIMRSDNPREAFRDIMFEAQQDDYYDWDGLFAKVEEELSYEEKEIYNESEDEIRDWLYDKYYFEIPKEHFNKSVKVNIMLDTGNMNYDFTCDNVLNWYGTDGGYGRKGEFDRNSSMLWLAKQQGKSDLLRKACKKTYRQYVEGKTFYADQTESTDKFVSSAISELANLPSHMATMTFLVEMSLFELFDLKDLIQAERELNKSYDLEERKGTGYIVLDKSTMCGLYDCWSGGGSLLEVKCEKDIKIPIKCIFDAVVDGTKMRGYDVNEVYGLIGSCWKPTLKEIRRGGNIK